MRGKFLYLSILAIALVFVLAACGDSDDDDDMSGMDMGASSTATPEMSGGMDMSETPDPSADPDLVFIDGMIVHHGSAVAMAEIAKEVSERQEILDLADEIIAAQEQEIEQLEQWRNEWYPDAPESDLSGMMGMSGMDMTHADEEHLRSATDFDKMFIDMMIPHHESAIEMAEALQQTTERPELEQLIENIITSQQAEIDQMREWREEWFGE